MRTRNWKLETRNWLAGGVLFAFCWLLPATLWAAVYTPTAFRIDGSTTTSSSACDTANTSSTVAVCNGWVLEIDVPTIGTTGTFNFGLGTNNSAKNANVILTVTSNGYQSGANCGSTTTYTRTLYATHIIREPYPNASTNDVTSSAGTTTFRMALGGATGPGWIFSADTVTVQIASSFFTDGSGNTVGTVAAGTAVTNNSTLAYSTVRALFNWTYPGWQRITGSTFTVRGTGFSQFAMNALPLACVVYTATDQHSDSVNVAVSHPTIDPTMGDQSKIVEYLGTISTSSFTAKDKITVTFKAYPWIGDSTAVMDSSDGVYSQPTPLYAPQYYVMDAAGTFGTAAAYVDPSANVSGSVTSGTFQVGEEVKQGTSSAIAYLIAVPGGSGPMHIGAVVSGTPNSTNTWVGQTSAAVFTPTATPTYVGSDSNSCAVAEASWNYGSPPSPCKTINGGAVKMAAYNNSNYSHNDASGTMYVETNGSGHSGYANWTGASATVSSTTSTIWCNIKPVGGGTLVIDAQSGSQSFGSQCTSGSTSCGTPIHLYGSTVNITNGPTSVFNGITYLWIDNSSIAANGTAPFYQVTDVYWTQSKAPSSLAGLGLGPFSTTNISFALIRGSDLSTVASSGRAAYVYTFVGNTNNSAGDCFTDNELTSQGSPASIMPIFAFNAMYKCQDVSNSLLGMNYVNSSIIGAAVVQNVFENIYSPDTLATVGLTADSSSGTPVNNVMNWENVYVGGRLNRSYQDSGTSTLLRLAWSEVGDLFDYQAIKSDTFGTASGNRTGNWMELYGTGNRSTLYMETAYSVDSGDFCNEFFGLNVYSTTVTAGSTQPPTCTATNSYTFPAYVSRQATNGSAGSGGGNYELKSNSPAVNMFLAGSQVLPYDLSGQLRNNSGWGSAGAYEQSKVLTPAFGF